MNITKRTRSVSVLFWIFGRSGSVPFFKASDEMGKIVVACLKACLAHTRSGLQKVSGIVKHSVGQILGKADLGIARKNVGEILGRDVQFVSNRL